MHRLIAAWSGLEQRVVDKAINECHGRLHACVRTDGQHFEHFALNRELLFLTDFTVL